jgi:transcriptional regulator with XRE-family HTH domain
MGWTGKSAVATVLRAMEEYRRQIGDRVRELRKARDWTIEDLAHAADVSVKTTSRLENGLVESRRSTVRKIAKALDVAEADILGAAAPKPGRPSQLDRIEAKVDDLRRHFGLEE